MPIRDLNEEQFVKLYSEIFNLDQDSDPFEFKVAELKIMFEIAKELRDLNRRLQDGIYIENPEEQQERITAQVLAILKNNPKESQVQPKGVTLSDCGSDNKEE
jgi:hypothetical protein